MSPQEISLLDWKRLLLGTDSAIQDRTPRDEEQHACRYSGALSPSASEAPCPRCSHTEFAQAVPEAPRPQQEARQAPRRKHHLPDQDESESSNEAAQ